MQPMRADSGESVLLRVRALLPALNEQEQKVGQYVLERPGEVIRLSVSELAQRSAASEATVVRFCRRIGTEGYQDFKIRLAQDICQPSSRPYIPVAEEDDLRSVVEKVIAADVKALEDTLKILDMAAMEAAADILLSARRVDVYGCGGGAIAAIELQYKLMRVGVRAVVHTDSEMQVISATLLTAADVAIAISYSGESPEILHALQVAGDSGARTISLTNHPASPVARAAEVSLTTSAQEAMAYGYPLGARVAQVALIDALYACLAQRRREETERNLSRIARALYRPHS